ncbi:unnamed protein product, partial [Linum tenue]
MKLVMHACGGSRSGEIGRRVDDDSDSLRVDDDSDSSWGSGPVQGNMTRCIFPVSENTPPRNAPEAAILKWGISFRLQRIINR